MATPLAHIAYAVVYSLMSKFAMDRKTHEAKSRERAFIFLPKGGKMEPTSISEKYWTDAILGDSMPAALMGHPGAYYTTVRGGEVGIVYTAQAILSPPNANRIFDGLDRLGDLEGTWEFLQTLDPTIMFGMDFDYTNLDYELVSSDLHSYNDRSYYTYSSYPAQDFIFNAYSHSTLGYLQQKIKDETDGKFDTIKPTVWMDAPNIFL